MFYDVLRTNTTEKKVLSRIVRRGAASRKEISEELGVTTATLTRVVASLMDQGLVQELGEMDEGRVGRRQILLDIPPDLGYVVGLDVTNLYIRLTVMDLHAVVLDEADWTFPTLTPDLLEQALDRAQSWIDARTPHKLLGVGLLLQGYLGGSGSLSLSVPMVRERVRRRLGVEPFMMNTVRGLAIAESYLGSPCKNYLLVKFGPGVASVVVQNGELWRGCSDRAGEIGHIVWSASSPVYCPICGRHGCLEALVGYRAIIHQAAPALDTQYPDLDTLLEASRRDGGASLNKALRVLAKAVNMMAEFIDPEQIVLAGQLFQYDDYFNYFSEQLALGLGGEPVRPVVRITDYERKRRCAAGIVVLSHFFG